MSVWRDILNLLTGSPGSMVYYLVTLFSAWAVVGLALSRWSRDERRGIIPRLLIAGGLISWGRLAFFVLALVDRTSSMGSSSYLVLLGPPLERFLDMISLVLICWAVVISHRQQILSRIFLGMGVLFAIGLYVILTMEWANTLAVDPTAAYNLSWQRWVWELSQLLLLIAALSYLAVVSVPERGTLVVMLSVLAAGHLAQAVLPLAQDVPHFAGWTRFAHLVVLPLFAVIAYRLVLQHFDAHAASLQSINQESLAQITGLMDLLDTNRKMSTTLDLDQVLQTAIRSASHTLRSDLCGIALIDPAAPDTATLLTRYRAPDITRNHQAFQTADHPPIQHAASRGKPVVFDSGTNAYVERIYRLLGSEQSGPLIVAPMTYHERVIGVMLVGQTGQTTPFTPVQIRKCEVLADHVSVAVGNALVHQRLQAQLEQRTAAHMALEQDFTRTRADLENRLKQSQDEINLYVQKLYETEQAEQRAQTDARELRQELGRQRNDKETVAHLQAELKSSLTQIAALTNKLATIDVVRTQMEERVQELEKERNRLQAQLAEAGNAYVNLEAHVRHLQDSAARIEQEPAVKADETVVQVAQCGIAAGDARGRITYLNPRAAQLIRQEWMGDDLFSLWPDDEWQAAAHAATDHYVLDPHLKPFHQYRQREHLQVTLTPLIVEGRHLGAVVTMHDTAMIDERNRARDEFLASLAQDLRTPMTSILGYTDLLMDEAMGQLEGMQRKFLQRVQANVERMGGMLNDLIGVTAIDSGKLMIGLEPVNIAQVIDSASRKIQFRLEEKELTTHVEIGDVPPITADPDCIQQVIDNLFSNACTVSTAGSTIQIAAHREVDQTGHATLHVAVSDTGGGILPQDRARVFERFYRAGDALIAGLGETGVGLAIVKALVEAHYGHVWVESELGQGTTFHLALPYGLEKTPGNGLQTRVISQTGDNGRD